MSGCPLLALTFAQFALWFSLSLCGLVGLMAIVSPRKFSLLAVRGSRWFDTNKVADVLDKRVDVDRYILPFSRLLGAVVVVAVAVLAYVLVRYA